MSQNGRPPDPATLTEGETLDMPEGLRAFSKGQVLGERYQILEMLGRGGMGEVWHAFDLKLRVEVALKALRPEFFKSERRLELLRQEVRAAREVVSPNVCRIFDLIEIEGRELVSMEYVDGATLLGVLQERGPLELKEAQDVASQFLAGLEAIHKVGLVHRDIKPENIMLTRAGRVIVMDFGLARQEVEGGGSVSGTPAYMAPEQAAGQQIDARADVFAAGVVLAEMVSPEGIRSFESRQSVWEGVRSEPAQVPDSPWAPVIQRAVARDRERRQNSAHTLIRELEDVTLRVEGAEDLHPYPGLASFSEEDAEYFFGREAEVEQMWRKLEGPPRLFAIMGPSGAGKSSFVRAGLVASAPQGWSFVVSTPGNAAISSLAGTVAREMAGDPDAVELLPRFDEPDVAVEVLARWGGRRTHSLLVVDQFEELFTQNSAETQRRFADLLRRFVLEANVHVLLSMRDDFASSCHAYESLRPIFDQLAVLDPPTGANLRRALVQPATKCGFRFEEVELVEEMMSEVEGERGALPLLAFAAARLWEKRDRETGLLTRQAYQDIGGVGGALAQHAEVTIDRIGSDRIPIVRELFRNLVTAEGTRAVREWTDLLSIFDEPQRRSADGVLRELIDARLLTSYELREDDREPVRRVEIIHESLLANWPRLVRWQTQDADAAQFRDQLRQTAKTWDDRGRSDDTLWTGSAYREFASWHERYPGGLTETEEAFASAMTSLATRRRRRRRMTAAAAFTILLVVLAVVGTLWRRSVIETRRAEAGKLLALGRTEIDRYPTAALAYVRRSLELADTPEARRFAVEILWRGPVARILPVKRLAAQEGVGGPDFFQNTALSPDGAWLATQTVDGQILLFPRDGGLPHHLPAPPDCKSRSIVFSPEGDLLVTSGRGQSLRFLSVPDLRELRSVELGGPFSLFWVRDRLLFTWTQASGDTRRRLLRSWALPSGEPSAVVAYDARRFSTRADLSDSRIVAGRGRELVVQRTDESRAERVVGELPNAVSAVSFLPGGDRLLSIDESGELRLSPLSDPSRIRILGTTSGGWGGRAFFDDQGRHVAVGDVNAAVKLWDLEDPPDAGPLVLQRPETLGCLEAAFDGEGQWLAVNNCRGGVAFWPLAGQWMRTLGGSGYDMSFSADDRWLAGCGGLFPLDPRDVGLRHLPPERYCFGLALDPAGTQLLVGEAGGGAYLYPLQEGTARPLPTGWEGRVSNGTLAVALDASGRWAAAAPFDMNPSIRDPSLRVLRIWDLETGWARSYPLAHLISEDPWWGFESFDFAPDGSLYAAGQDGVRRFTLPLNDEDSVAMETLHAAGSSRLDLSEDGRRLLVLSSSGRSFDRFEEMLVFDLASGIVDRVGGHGQALCAAAVDRSGGIVVTGDEVGMVRVGRVTDDEPHLLIGHTGSIESVAISRDGRWVASSSDDAFLLWPMPDLDKPPLHMLPHDELVATLHSFTNLRIVRDEESSTGWKLEVGPFPGWAEVPEW
jgi:WD40 repeat protein